MMKRKRFTLIELMVVMVIIITLMGLLIPAFNRIRELSYRTESLNNIKQISLAMVQYASMDLSKSRFPCPPKPSDYDAANPTKWNDPGLTSADIAYFLLDKEIIEAPKLFLCRSLGDNYEPMMIQDDMDDAGNLKDFDIRRWLPDSELHYQIYSDYKFSASQANRVLVASHDNPTLESCQHWGEGWNVGFSDGSGEWIRRPSRFVYEDKETMGPANDTYRDGTENLYGGGSAEIMGKSIKHKNYKWFTIDGN